PTRVTRLLVGPFEEREDHALPVLGLDGAGEAGDFAHGGVDAPGLDIAQNAMFEEHLGGLGGEFAIGLAVAVRHRHDEAVDIAAAGAALFEKRLEPADDHALAVERHVLAEFLHARIAHDLL